MKEQIINNVLSAMQGVLDCRQMKILKVSLQEQLQGVRISQTETPNATKQCDIIYIVYLHLMRIKSVRMS